jgi:hypothetical protein
VDHRVLAQALVLLQCRSVAPTPSLLDRFGASLCLPDPLATAEHAGSGDVMRAALETLFFDNRVDMVITGTRAVMRLPPFCGTSSRLHT